MQILFSVFYLVFQGSKELLKFISPSLLSVVGWSWWVCDHPAGRTEGTASPWRFQWRCRCGTLFLRCRRRSGPLRSLSRSPYNGQRRLRLGAGVELVCAAPQDPVALLWAHGEPAMTLGVGGGKSHAPVAVVGYVHLPVVAATAVALPAEHTGPGVESLRAVGQVGL